MKGNLLFDMLAPAAKERVIASMMRLDVLKGTQIIRQGETNAKHFYVLAEGACEAFISKDSDEARRRKVFSYEPGRWAPAAPPASIQRPLVGPGQDNKACSKLANEALLYAKIVPYSWTRLIDAGKRGAKRLIGSNAFIACSGFGELALLYSAPRAATVEATAACRLWVMERVVYNAIKLEHTAAASAEKLKLIDAVPLLKLLRPVRAAPFALAVSHRVMCSWIPPPEGA